MKDNKKRLAISGKEINKIKLKSRTDLESGKETQDKATLRIMAALLYASLEGNASIQETANGELEITTIEGQVFTLKYLEDRVTLGGSEQAPNLDQFLGKIEDPIKDVSEIVENAVELIQAQKPKEAPQPPIKFEGAAGGLEQEQDPGQGQLIPAQTPETEMDPSQIDIGAMDDGSMSPPMDVPPPMDQSQMPMNSQAPPVSTPLTPPPVPMPQPGMMPAASKKRITAALDIIADDVQKAGHKDLAERIDRIANTLES